MEPVLPSRRATLAAVLLLLMGMIVLGWLNGGAPLDGRPPDVDLRPLP